MFKKLLGSGALALAMMTSQAAYSVAATAEVTLVTAPSAGDKTVMSASASDSTPAFVDATPAGDVELAVPTGVTSWSLVVGDPVDATSVSCSGGSCSVTMTMVEAIAFIE